MENTIENATAFLDELSDAFPKMRFSQAMVEYAASVRPDVVVPKAKIIEPYMNSRSREIIIAQNDVIEHVKSLNPALTFTELNHEK